MQKTKQNEKKKVLNWKRKKQEIVYLAIRVEKDQILYTKCNKQNTKIKDKRLYTVGQKSI